MAWPSVASSFSDPNPNDRLNSPSHSSVEGNQNTALRELQAFIGTLSSVQGTLIYDVRGAGSNGGGHVQTADKGGTGQTSYNKGDLLTGQSSSVLTKLAVGTDGQILQANSSVAAGVKWVTNQTNKVATSIVGTTFGASSVTETSIFSISIPGSTLGTNSAIRANVFIGNFGTGAVASVLFKANYGSTAIASVLVIGDGNGTTQGYKGKAEINLLAVGASAQNAETYLSIQKDERNVNSASVFGMHAQMIGSSSVLSDSAQNLGMTVRFSTSDPSNGVKIDSVVIEKIV